MLFIVCCAPSRLISSWTSTQVLNHMFVVCKIVERPCNFNKESFTYCKWTNRNAKKRETKRIELSIIIYYCAFSLRSEVVKYSFCSSACLANQFCRFEFKHTFLKYVCGQIRKHRQMNYLFKIRKSSDSFICLVAD